MNLSKKIIVHEADRSTGKREQKVDIHLNFIGNFVPPPVDIPLTPKEIAKREEAERTEQKKAVARKVKSREKSRRWREKIKANGTHEQALAKRRAEYAERRNALITQAIAEGAQPPRPYKPQNKYKSA